MAERMLWDRMRNRLVIRGELEAVTAFRVGQAAETSPVAPDLPVMQDERGRPYIPGSSLRGVLRSHVERLVRTLQPVENGRYAGRGACIPVHENQWCIPKEKMEKPSEKARMDKTGFELAAWVYDQSCLVCRLFGSPWLASRVRFTDLFPAGEAVLEERDAVAIDREKETVAHKYDFQVVAPGAGFALEILAENVQDVEIGLLLWALNELEEGFIRLGGFKGRGLGRVKLSRREVLFLDGTRAGDLLQYARKREMPPMDERRQQECIEELFNFLRG